MVLENPQLPAMALVANEEPAGVPHRPGLARWTRRNLAFCRLEKGTQYDSQRKVRRWN